MGKGVMPVRTRVRPASHLCAHWTACERIKRTHHDAGIICVFIGWVPGVMKSQVVADLMRCDIEQAVAHTTAGAHPVDAEV